jgi:hypothetical protein
MFEMIKEAVNQLSAKGAFLILSARKLFVDRCIICCVIVFDRAWSCYDRMRLLRTDMVSVEVDELE